MIHRIALTAFLLLALAAPAWADFASGQAAMHRGDDEAAYREWLPLAQADDPHAQFHLGVLYERGWGVPQDFREAARWYRKAAAKVNDFTEPPHEDRVKQTEALPEEKIYAWKQKLDAEKKQAQEDKRKAEEHKRVIEKQVAEAGQRLRKINKAKARAEAKLQEAQADEQRFAIEPRSAETRRKVIEAEDAARRAREWLTLIAKAEEKGREKQRALQLTLHLATQRAAEAESEVREAEKAAKATIEDLFHRIAEQQESLDLVFDAEPPKIKVVSKPDSIEFGEDSIQIAGVVGDMDGPPRRFTINGQQVPLFKLGDGDEKIAAHNSAFRFNVTPTEWGERRFVLEATDAAGNRATEEVVVRVTIANRPNIKAKNYALIIGNSEYENLADLETPVNDAKALAAVLRERYVFEEDGVVVLLNATRRAVMNQLSRLRMTLGAEDRLLLYYAGHSLIDVATGEGYWQPVDAEPENDFTWISNSDVRRYLAVMPAKHVLVVADSAFSGLLRHGSLAQNENDEKFFFIIDRYPSRNVITWSDTKPKAISRTGKQSIFSYTLIEALRKNKFKYLTSFQLFDIYFNRAVLRHPRLGIYGRLRQLADLPAGDFTFILGAQK